MHCIVCDKWADGYAVVPGVGPSGEIRFHCEDCARRGRLKMRYWDGRDLAADGEAPPSDLGEHFESLVFSFEDLARMRREDMETLLRWVEAEDLAAALVGCDTPFQAGILDLAGAGKAQGVRSRLKSPPSERVCREARRKIIDLVRRL